MKQLTPTDFFEIVRARLRSDMDCLILFTGPERMGKSTIMFQVMRALDENFNVERCHFGIGNFLANAVPPPALQTYKMRARSTGNGVYGVAADELEADRRRPMEELTKDLLDFLKDCGGLNLLMAMCYPREQLFDGAILNFRVAYKIDVPRRGLAILYERAERKWRRSKTGVEEISFVWVERGRWRTKQNRGALWDAYRVKKGAHMLSLGEKYRELQEEHAAAASPFGHVQELVDELRGALERAETHFATEAQRQDDEPARASGSSWGDRGGLVHELRGLERKYEQSRGPAAAVRDLP